MRIKEITSQHRRDFSAIYECEHCLATRPGQGYDDDNFHRYVVPNMQCSECSQTAPDSYRPLGTKYAAHEHV